MALANVKARLAKFQEDIDEADTRTTNAKHDIREAQTRLEKAEGELGTHRRRIKLLEGELQSFTERYGEVDEKYQSVVSLSEDIETKRKELEENEVEGDERLQETEEKVKQARLLLEENEIKLVEVKRKAVVLKNDIEKITDKANSHEQRMLILEETVESTGECLRDLEQRESQSSDKETLNEEKIAFLEGQMKEAEVRVEAAERQAQNLERVIGETDSERLSWVSKREEIQREMEDIEGMEDLCA